MRFFVVPALAAILCLPLGLVPALLVGIFASLLYPYWHAWRLERLEIAAARRLDKQFKMRYESEDQRHLGLGLPSQKEERDHKAMALKYAKPHYFHLKLGIREESCLYCDQSNSEFDERHLRIWGEWEREEAMEHEKMEIPSDARDPKPRPTS